MNKFYGTQPPTDAELKRSAALTKVIAQAIADHDGMLPFAKFMSLALYHPTLGYYHAEPFSIGDQGDFITAPHISPLFSRTIAHPCLPILASLKDKNILELGPGMGQFCADLLRELQRLDALPDHYFLYEISPTLRKKQHDFLEKTCPDLLDRIVFLDTLPADFNGIILANEVLDAIPFDLFYIDQSHVLERFVTEQNGHFTWQNAPAKTPDVAKNGAHAFLQYHLPDGYISELHLNTQKYVRTLTRMLKQGVIFFIDYGYGEREYYHPARNKGTLTCFYHHQKNDDPLQLPGLQDITAHVNFTQVIEIAAENGCDLAGYTTQAAFLIASGLLSLAKETASSLSPTEEFELYQSIKTLTLPTEMGERIKVMALSKGIDQSIVGFNLEDRRRDL